MRNLKKSSMTESIKGKVDGILLDLGVSSPQLDEAHRGFSFMRDGPLDMRMDPDSGISARHWLASVEESELKQVISRLGEERHAARIASAVVAARATTADRDHVAVGGDRRSRRACHAWQARPAKTPGNKDVPGDSHDGQPASSNSLHPHWSSQSMYCDPVGDFASSASTRWRTAW